MRFAQRDPSHRRDRPLDPEWLPDENLLGEKPDRVVENEPRQAWCRCSGDVFVALCGAVTRARRGIVELPPVDRWAAVFGRAARNLPHPLRAPRMFRAALEYGLTRERRHEALDRDRRRRLLASCAQLGFLRTRAVPASPITDEPRSCPRDVGAPPGLDPSPIRVSSSAIRLQ
jgi:hypothetical protein